MFERIAITLPKELEKVVERKRKELNLNRSELFRKAVESFLGLEDNYEKKALQKYGPVYETMQKEDRKLAKEMMTLAKKSLPPD